MPHRVCYRAGGDGSLAVGTRVLSNAPGVLPPGVTSGRQRSGSASEEPFVACEYSCEAVSVSSKEECVVSGTV